MSGYVEPSILGETVLMMNMLDLSNKTVVITGGAGAIGQVVVATLAEHGARVAVNDLLPSADAGATFIQLTSRSCYWPRLTYKEIP